MDLGDCGDAADDAARPPDFGEVDDGGDDDDTDDAEDKKKKDHSHSVTLKRFLFL